MPYLVEDLVDKSVYRFVIENGLDKCYLINEKGEKVYQWEFDMNLGQDIELTDNGNLIGMFKVQDPSFGFGGQSGLIRKLDKNSAVLWQYKISDENEIAHHDLELLPNGNLLILVWKRIDKSIANEVGFETNNDIFVEKIIELNPTNNSIVWEWDSWDHIIQNKNSALNNFGEANENKHKIDILYNSTSDLHQFISQGDIMHANGLSYNQELDVIAVSVNFYSEVWFIDHSTTTEQAKTSNGGNYNKGGDLIYRFGNPSTYGSVNQQIFDFNHHPSFINNGSDFSLLIFNNNNKAGISKAMEFSLPNFNEIIDFETNPNLIFEYSNEDMYFPRVGGAVRLPNGNTLICEGDYGYWEVSAKGELLWKYDGLGTSFWRGLYYSKNSNAIKSLGL